MNNNKYILNNLSKLLINNNDFKGGVTYASSPISTNQTTYESTSSSNDSSSNDENQTEKKLSPTYQA